MRYFILVPDGDVKEVSKELKYWVDRLRTNENALTMGQTDS